MSPLPLPTATCTPSPSAHNSLLATRSTSSEDPLMPLYVILGVIGGLFTLLVLAPTFLLGGCFCCYQARKACQTVAGNRRHKTNKTYNSYRHWYRYPNPSNNAPSIYWSHDRTMGPRHTHHIQAAPSELYNASPTARRASFDDHQTHRLALTCPLPGHTNHLRGSESGSYPFEPQVHRNHNRSPSLLSMPMSRSGYHSNYSPPSDIYVPRQSFESYKRGQPPSHLLQARPASRSSRIGHYGPHYKPSRRPKPPYESLSRRSSRERFERRASRPEQLPSLSSDGRPSLTS